MTLTGIVLQAVLSAITCSLLVLFGYPLTGRLLAGVVALLGVLLWLVNRGIREPNSEDRSGRLVPLTFLLVAGTPWLALLVSSSGHEGSPDDAETILAITVLGSAVFLVMYLSSLVDWYYVLPRLRRGQGKSPCTDSLDGYWRRVTQIWLLHRLIATVTLVGATIAVVALAANQWVLGLNQVVAAALAAAATVLAGFYLSRLPFAVAMMLNPPLHIGDKIQVAEMFPQPATCPDYYVSEISLEGVKLVELDGEDRPARAARERSYDRLLDLSDVHKLLRVRDKFAACNECKRVNPYCEWERAERATDRDRAG